MRHSGLSFIHRVNRLFFFSIILKQNCIRTFLLFRLSILVLIGSAMQFQRFQNERFRHSDWKRLLILLHSFFVAPFKLIEFFSGSWVKSKTDARDLIEIRMNGSIAHNWKYLDRKIECRALVSSIQVERNESKRDYHNMWQCYLLTLVMVRISYKSKWFIEERQMETSHFIRCIKR